MAVALLDLDRAASLFRRQNIGQADEEEKNDLMDRMRMRRTSVQSDQGRFAALCDRWDNLYYPQSFTTGGADHWPTDKTATQAGRTHVSINSYQTYVDIPAALQSFPPIENMVPLEQTEPGRVLAALVERLYFAWKDKTGFELLSHKACVTKGLYGRTAAKIFWDDDKKYPVVELIDQPRNLYLGWRDSAYEKLEWAIYAYTITPETALEDWGVIIDGEQDEDGKVYPYVLPVMTDFANQSSAAAWRHSSELRVEVNDYWYRKPRKNARIEAGKSVKFETWNAIFVGNLLVSNKMHREYRGQLPFIPLFNSYVPGLPDGKSNLHDIEQIQREKDERISENAQMIHRAVSGQYWQLTGPEAPAVVPSGLEPVANAVIAPGAGNRIEALQPWMPEFQMEQYLTRLDRELTDISGLNELMRGMAPTQVLSSGKAISALVSNYETRISMPRQLYYDWRSDIWDLAATLWAEKVPELKEVIEGKTKLLIQSPSLTPRDDAEMSTIALNMKDGKLWSSIRAMDRTGVDDPESEQDLIRAEQTDATLNPAAVQVMVSLMLMMQQMQQQQPPGPEQMAGVGNTLQAGLNDMRQGGAPQGMPSLNGEVQPQTPPEMMPGNTPEGAAMGAGGPMLAEGAPGAAMGPEGEMMDAGGAPLLGPDGQPMPTQSLNQFQIADGEVSNRLIGQQTLQKTGEK